MKRILRYLVIGISGVVLAFALFVGIENVRGRVALAKYRKELQARGEKLSVQEFDIPKAPREGNGTEALLKAASELAALKEKCPLVVGGVSTLKFVAPGKAQVVIAQRVFTDPFVFLHGADKKHLLSWEDFTQEVNDAGPILSRIKKALNQPFLGLDVDYNRGFEALPTKHLGGIRTIARALSALTIHDLRQKNLDGAVEDLGAMTNLDRLLKDDRLIISQLVRIAVTSIELNTVWQALQSPGWSDAQLARLQNTVEISSQGGVESMQRSFEMERAMNPGQYKKLRANWTALRNRARSFRALRENGLDEKKSWALNTEVLMELRCGLWKMAWSHQDELHGMRNWQKLIEGTRMVAQTKSWISAKPLLDQVDADNGKGLYNGLRFLLSISYVGMGRAVLSTVRVETQREMTVAAIALKRHQLRHGKLPPHLDDLVPEFLSKTPRDDMDGKTLRYRANADQTFVLYSVGEDGRDDEGDPSPVTNKSFPLLWEGYDAVWPAPVFEEEAVTGTKSDSRK